MCAPCVLHQRFSSNEQLKNKQGLLALTLALGAGCSCVLSLRGQTAEKVPHVELLSYVLTDSLPP